jgi:hypothetical protein
MRVLEEHEEDRKTEEKKEMGDGTKTRSTK